MSPADGGYHDDRIENLRVPPQSIEAEMAVLGGLMLAPDALSRVADMLKPEDFYRRDHQLIFSAITDLASRTPPEPYDAVTLGEWFEAKGQIAQVHGGAYLVELASTTPSAANVRAYAKIVADKATLRCLIEAGTVIVNDGFDPQGRDTGEIVASAASRVAHLTLRGAREGGLRMVSSGIDEAFEEIVGRDAGTIDVGLTPPWDNVRDILPGLEDTDLLVLAARPGMGKTIAGLEFADHAAAQGRNVGFFSMEMSRRQLITRLIARRARVDQSLMRQKGGLSQAQWAEINRAIREIRNLSLAIDDTVSLTIDAMKARAARMHAKVQGGLGLIVVDYLQLMEGDGVRGENRNDVISKISRGLKHIAKELRCPVIALSQLNRSLEARPNKRPVMSDLRESGAIEQDADIIAFLYRDDYYTKDRCGAPGIAEFIIGKQRQGRLDTAYLNHHLECSAFSDYHGKRPNYAPSKDSANSSDDGFDDVGSVASWRDRAAGPDR